MTGGPFIASAEGALRFLVAGGLLPGEALVNGRAGAEERSMSHRSFLVTVDAAPRWFVKCADLDKSGGRDLGSEAFVYELAGSSPSLAAVLPKLYLVAEGGRILVIEAVAGLPLQDSNPTAGVLRRYGEAVARAHRSRPVRFGQPPWLLSALEPRWGSYDWLPPACAGFLVRLTRSATVRKAFDRTRAEWRVSCLIHGDIRWANALAGGENGTDKIWLVDWELASAGDPAWDLGSLVADVAATTAMDIGAPRLTGEWTEQCRALLTGYRNVARVPERAWGRLVERSIRMGGVRLVQTILEYGHSSQENLEAAETAMIPWALTFLTQAPAIGRQLAGVR